MDNRQQYVDEIHAACEELKTAGIPHAVDLAKHIVRMKRDLMFYDKCMKIGVKNHSSKQSRS